MKASDIIAFGALLLSGLIYMNAGRKSVFWLLLIVGFAALGVSIFSRTNPKHRASTQSGESNVQQSTGNVSGGSTVNQAGRDVIINQGVSESTIRTILADKTASANKELTNRYPLGWILMGISDGNVIFQPNTAMLQLDSNSKITISINEANKTAVLHFDFFKVSRVNAPGSLQMEIGEMAISYVENVPAKLRLFAMGLPDGRTAYPYIELLDSADKIFVLGFKDN